MRKKVWFAAAPAASLIAVLLPSVASAQVGATVPNWPVPSVGSGARGGMRALSDIGHGIAFVAVTPCRIVDTRGPAGTFGGPALSAGGPRNFPIPSGPCPLIPAAGAYSLNLTVVNTAGSGFIKVYPQGGAAPVVSTLNYAAGQTVANAAIVPAGASGGITAVAGVSGADLIIDINGYYSEGYNTGNFFSTVGDVTGGGVVVGHNTNTAGTGYGGEFVSDSTANGSAGMRGVAAGSSGVTAGVRGENASTSASAAGVLGIINSTSPGGFSAAVRGINNGTGGLGIGVWGSQAGSGWGTYGSSVSGVGVIGVVSGTGANFGVFGSTASHDGGAAGVYGKDEIPSTGTGSLPAGVVGTSRDNIGVQGLSETTAVRGTLFNGSGGPVMQGLLGYDGGPYGVFAVGDFGGTGAKFFVEPHPYDASKVIRYVALEGPEAGTYFRGRGRIQRGAATIEVPEHFRLVTDAESLTVQVTPIGEMASVAVVDLGLDRIVVRSSKDVEFFYLVQGERKSHRNLQPIRSGREFMPESPTAAMPEAYTPVQREVLISNGTYNPDGTPNLATAERLGWTRAWADRRDPAREPVSMSDPAAPGPGVVPNAPTQEESVRP